MSQAQGAGSQGAQATDLSRKPAPPSSSSNPSANATNSNCSNQDDDWDPSKPRTYVFDYDTIRSASYDTPASQLPSNPNSQRSTMAKQRESSTIYPSQQQSMPFVRAPNNLYIPTGPASTQPNRPPHMARYSSSSSNARMQVEYPTRKPRAPKQSANQQVAPTGSWDILDAFRAPNNSVAQSSDLQQEMRNGQQGTTQSHNHDVMRAPIFELAQFAQLMNQQFSLMQPPDFQQNIQFNNYSDNSAAYAQQAFGIETFSNGERILDKLVIPGQQGANLIAAQNVPYARTARTKIVPTEEDLAQQDKDVDAHDDDFQQAETYAEYMPSKLKIGCKHPDPVVETASLATVMPPDITYELVLPKKIIKEGLLSALQLEAVVYASQQHERILPDKITRAGFLIGDGAGVGKGRTIAGIIYENYLRGRKKSIWLSVSNDLKLDAERDLRDIGAEKIPVHLLGKFPYGKRLDCTAKGGFVVFSTYQGLISSSTSVRGSLSTRMGQLINWVGENFDGVIVFDECHKAKNISANGKGQPSKTAKFALDIQHRLPNSRVVYASATGASETRNMGYMTRLGIWGVGTPFPTFSDFCSSIERRGVGAMELVAIDLKMRGAYMARQLSFKGTTFTIEKVKISDEYIKVYNGSVDLWVDAKEGFERALHLFRADSKTSRQIWTQFWSSHQRYFKYLCIGAKVPYVIQISKEALAQGKSVVIGLQSTGEAKTLEALEECFELTDFISTARAVFETLVENYFPAPEKSRKSTPVSPKAEDSPVDESWHDHRNIQFSVENGLVTAKLNPKDAKELKLRELAAQKKAISARSSARSQRANRRAAIKATRMSRIVQVDDSDTEISSVDPSSNSSYSRTSTDIEESDVSESSHTSDETLSEDPDDIYAGRNKRKKNPWQLRKAALKKKKSVTSKTDKDSNKRPSKTKVSAKKRMISSDSDTDDEVQIISDLTHRSGNPKTNEGADKKPSGSEEKSLEDMPEDYGPILAEMRDSLLKKLDELAPGLPNNTLDDLINHLGGPRKVAEMTGRKGRVVALEDGSVSYESRNETDVSLELLNIKEKARFMNDEKHVAIISEAASSGISLQADRRAKNQRRRVHITIELPWSADRAIQQFGRTHRSNQTSAPEYMFLISELAGEQRFASIVAKRLESLGALTHGDRRATTESRDLSQFNILTKYGREALEIVLKTVIGEMGNRFSIKPKYDGDFFKDARQALIGCGLASSGSNFSGLVFLDKDACNTTKFLNRLLGMKVEIQNALFQYFIDTMDAVIARHKRLGNYDSGIMELSSGVGKVRCDKPDRYSLSTGSGPVECELLTVRVERGISWSEISQIYQSQQKHPQEGFYTVQNPIVGSTHIFLALLEESNLLPEKYRIYKPNSGIANKCETLSNIKDRATKVGVEKAEKIWTKIYDATDTQCTHMCFFNKCSRVLAGMKCDIGLRHRQYCILSGGVLTAWPYLESRAPNVTSKLSIVRLKTSDGTKLIGPSIPLSLIDVVKELLREGVEKGVNF